MVGPVVFVECTFVWSRAILVGKYLPEGNDHGCTGGGGTLITVPPPAVPLFVPVDILRVHRARRQKTWGPLFTLANTVGRCSHLAARSPGPPSANVGVLRVHRKAEERLKRSIMALIEESSRLRCCRSTHEGLPR